jgi:hypothetical protein
MSDQCVHCAVRGDLHKCRATECFQHENWYAVEMIKENKLLETELAEVKWRLHHPYDAFLRDAAKKDNCRNCIHVRPPTISHNPDRISCQHAEGWPHWSTKCGKWELKP